MPEEEKLRPSQKQVDLDTSGPEVDVTLEDTKEEAVVDTAPETTEQEIEVKTDEEKQEDDSKLEEVTKIIEDLTFTGEPSDGIIAISNIESVLNISSKEKDSKAL